MNLASCCSHKWVVLLCWQGFSVALCAIGVIATYLSTYYGTTLTLLMIFLTYFLVFIASMWPPPRSEIPWWRYMVLGVCYVIGDYLAVLAYNYTSLASALLLVTTVVFYVAPLSFFVFKRKIRLWQMLGIALGLAGVIIVFFADNGQKGSKVLGDVIAIISAICYAIATVLQEYLVHSDSIKLYLFRFSATATPLAGILCGAIEHKTIKNWNWTPLSGGLIVLYSVLLAAYDICGPLVMRYSTATEMNLSMLTSNFYSLLISILAFGQKASWLYLVGFFCIPIAIIVYTLGTPKEEHKPEEIQEEEAAPEGEDPPEVQKAKEGASESGEYL